MLQFLKKYQVLLVSVPSIALIHFFWYRLQFNTDFVKEHERKNLKLAGVLIDPPKQGDKE